MAAIPTSHGTSSSNRGNGSTLTVFDSSWIRRKTYEILSSHGWPFCPFHEIYGHNSSNCSGQPRRQRSDRPKRGEAANSATSPGKNDTNPEHPDPAETGDVMSLLSL